MELDTTQLTAVLARLHWVQGQVGGVIRMIEEGQDCAKVITQGAASKALGKAGFQVMETGMRQCLTTVGDGDRAVDRAQLEKLFLCLA